MPRLIGKLTTKAVSNKKTSGLYSDGGGLYLRVTTHGGKFWVFRFMLNGKAREMGLGAEHTVTLANARDKAQECRKLLSEGIDPIELRDMDEAQKRLKAARTQTFKACAEAYIDAHKESWRNAKHASQWVNTLATYVYPVFGEIPVQDVDTALIMKVLEPLWKKKAETASRIRGRIEAILDWASVREYRKGDNPARWRGHLENLLPRRSKVQRIEHQPALPYDRIGHFMATLKDQEGSASLALAFTILTASRTSETIGAAWDEIDLQKKLWTIPASRIKGGREHRVPLSEPALDILKELQKQRGLINPKSEKVKNDWVFTGQRKGKPLSNMAMLALLKRMKRTDITVHGFRSTFRDWAAEQTAYPREIVEACLAHASGDKVERAYLRTDFFDRRRQLMDVWGRCCAEPASKVTGKVLAFGNKLQSRANK